MERTIHEEIARGAAARCGLEFLGLRPAGPAPGAGRLDAWLRSGRAAGLDWMRRSAAARGDPRVYRPGTSVVAMTALRYGSPDPPASLWDDPFRGRVARFAWGPDYHGVLSRGLSEMAFRLEAAVPGLETRGRFADSRPVLERAWAADTGAGFIGRNTQFIRPGQGSYLLLGGLLLGGVRASPDAAPRAARETEPCGECGACLRACPGGALEDGRLLDCARCVSYWTIEHKGVIPAAAARRIGRWVFGCDACQEVCPFVRNRGSAPAPGHVFRADRDAPVLGALLLLDEDGFRSLYGGTPVERAGLSRLRRNALVAGVNAGAAGWLEAARSDPDPLLRAQAAVL